MTPKQFNALPEFKRAVLVAKDVLLQLRTNACTMAEGSYMEVRSQDRFDLEASATPSLIKKLHCEVCAKGALFLSHVRLANQATVDGVINASAEEMRDRLAPIFGDENWDSIEDTFEGFFGGHNFHNAFTDPKERAAAIMLNIIKHKGAFVMSYIPSMRSVKAALRAPRRRKTATK